MIPKYERRHPLFSQFYFRNAKYNAHFKWWIKNGYPAQLTKTKQDLADLKVKIESELDRLSKVTEKMRLFRETHPKMKRWINP